jgi:hypothetical protein
MYNCSKDCKSIHNNTFVKEKIGAEKPMKKKSLRIPTEKLFESSKSEKKYKK